MIKEETLHFQALSKVIHLFIALLNPPEQLIKQLDRRILIVCGTLDLLGLVAII